jgi:hypothetical protein
MITHWYGLVRQIVRLVLSSKGPRPLGGDEPTLSLSFEISDWDTVERS